jgi:hypothetical protein
LADESRGSLRREVLALRRENAVLRQESAALRKSDAALRRANAVLVKQAADLRALIEKLQARIAILEKVSGAGPKTPPASTSTPEQKAEPSRKRRGRPKGHPGTGWRAPDQPAEVVELPLDQCPDCGGELTAWRDTQDHVVVDLPPIEAVVVCYRHERGYCPHCRRTVRSPCAADEPPHGHLGLRVLGLVTELRTRAGMSYPHIAALLSGWGFSVGAGTLTKACRRVAEWLTPMHRELLARIRDAPFKHADETSWPVNGRNGWCWGFVHGTTCAYVIEPSRGAKVARAVLGDDPFGTLISDFYGVYVWLGRKHQWCWAHLLREAKEVAAVGGRGAARFRETLGAIFRDAEIVATAGLPAPALQREAAAIAQRLSDLRKGKSRCEGVERLKTRIANHQDGLLTFLHHPEIEPTNNRAERELRPIVLVRKTTGGSRSWDGARTLAVLASCQRSLAPSAHDWLALIRAHVCPPPSRARLASVLDV